MLEAKAAAKRKGAFVMMVEQDLMLARFLAGLYSHKVLAVSSLTTALFHYNPLPLQPSSTTTLFDYNPFLPQPPLTTTLFNHDPL